MTNAFHSYFKSGAISLEAHASALNTALNLDITLVGDPDLHRQASIVAQTYNLPATYGAHYLALAERWGVELWTTDRRLVDWMQAKAVNWVKLAVMAG